jgi:hypothetical protein
MPESTSVRSIAVSRIDPAAFNPPARVQQSSLRSLGEDIALRGIVSPAHVVPAGDSFLLADGHRRRAVAVAQGIEKMWCIVHNDVTVDQVPALWGALNRHTRPISSVEWMDAWVRSDGELGKAMPKGIMANIRECIKIFGGGKACIAMLVEKKISANIQTIIRKLHRTLDAKPDAPSQRKIGEWMVKHRGAQLILGTLYANKGISFSVLRKIRVRIETDKPILWSELIPQPRVKHG